MRDIGSVTAEGQAFRMDANLGPKGRPASWRARSMLTLSTTNDGDGPGNDSRLIKSRVAAGDRELGDRFDRASPRRHVWTARLPRRSHRIRHLKARMERERIPADRSSPELQTGSGGPLRRRVRGPAPAVPIRWRAARAPRHTDTSMRSEAACPAGHLDDEAAIRLDEAYRFLARLRNRLFLMHGRAADSFRADPRS